MNGSLSCSCDSGGSGKRVGKNMFHGLCVTQFLSRISATSVLVSAILTSVLKYPVKIENTK